MAITLSGDGITSDNITSLAASKLTGQVADANAPSGSVIQVVQTVKTDFFATSSTSAVDITGLSASITPSSSSNKILILANISYSNSQYTNGGFSACYFWVTDGSNNVIGQADADGARQRVSMGGHSFYQAGNILQKQFTFLWSPGTTSAQTVKMRTAASTSGDVTVCKSYNENNVGTPGGNFTAISQITLMEISP